MLKNLKITIRNILSNLRWLSFNPNYLEDNQYYNVVLDSVGRNNKKEIEAIKEDIKLITKKLLKKKDDKKAIARAKPTWE